MRAEIQHPAKVEHKPVLKHQHPAKVEHKPVLKHQHPAKVEHKPVLKHQHPTMVPRRPRTPAIRRVKKLQQLPAAEHPIVRGPPPV
jgi:hypothetical protein